ncbi:MAG: signal recognition particle receptor subunit alpha, partial [Candidatus Diapherotrites archaeon]|nr:signal recognition particle receptor subunit alpha [Candidatus Diapherotrites archaeon]
MSLGEHLRNALEKFRNSGTMDKTTVKEAVKEIQRALIGSDVEIKLVLELSKKIEEEAFRDLPEGVNRKEHVIKKTHDFLAELLGGTETQIPQKPGKILLCGLFGSGKTTTSGKLGKYFSKRGQKVGVICADSFRPAAYHQLKQLCEQTDLKFFGIPDEKHAATIVKKGLQELKDCELIIVDSAGRSALDDELVKEIKEIEAVLKAEQKWLVLSADIGQVAKKQAVAFHDAIGMNGVIITKLDGSSKGGGALAACSVTQSPVYFIGTGEKMNDLEEFESTRYLGRIMGYGDLKALLEKVQEAEVNVNQDDAEKILRGEFTLQMFYDQLKAARSMGPLNKVMDLMGLKQKIPQEVMDMGEAKLDNFKVIMDSMT